ncbi:MAG: hypothetical protein ACJ762_08080 [Solirubrobacteraceae bacterium]
MATALMCSLVVIPLMLLVASLFGFRGLERALGVVEPRFDPRHDGKPASHGQDEELH